MLRQETRVGKLIRVWPDLLLGWVIKTSFGWINPKFKPAKKQLDHGDQHGCDQSNGNRPVIKDWGWRGCQDRVMAWSCLSFCLSNFIGVWSVGVYHTVAPINSHSSVSFSIRHCHPSISSFSPPFYPSSPIIPPSSSPSPSASSVKNKAIQTWSPSFVSIASSLAAEPIRSDCANAEIM